MRSIRNPLFRFLFIPIAGANFGIPLLAAIFSVVAFFYFKNGTLDITRIEIFLIFVNMVAFVYSSAWGIVVERRR